MDGKWKERKAWLGWKVLCNEVLGTGNTHFVLALCSRSIVVQVRLNHVPVSRRSRIAASKFW